jgi:chromosome segregation ATPase
MDKKQATWNGLKSLQEQGLLDEDNPDIVAIFEQIKHLRENERSIRSLRRSLTLDNMPVLDVEEEIDAEVPPASELTQLLDSYMDLKREKSDLQGRFNELVNGFADLQETVRRQAEELERLRTGAAS